MKAKGKCCENCIHWQKEPGSKWDAWDVACCTISMGLDCYHNKDEHWKHWKGFEDFIDEEEMKL
jgi:hypothetical protein